ncbi:LacI family DNA-binding transcriptional regulator [Enterococcus sp. LJL120]
MKKHVTIQEVANRAGVSKTTISRYLNGKFGNMSLDTKRKIQLIIDELDYRPSKQAQGLKSNKSWLIGLLVADIANQYTAYIIKAVQDALMDTGYQLLIMNTNNSEAEEQRAIQKLIDQNIDGILLQPVATELTAFQQIIDQEIPTVLVDRSLNIDRWTTVQTNNIQVSKKMTEIIVANGYQKIIHVSEAIGDISPRAERYQGIRLGTLDTNCQVELLELHHTGKGQDIVEFCSGHEFTEKTCFFAANGNAMYEAVVGLNNCQLKFPTDCGLAGYDDWFWGELIQPGITTIHQLPERIGERAVEVLMQEIEIPQPTETIEIAAEIHLRGSL